MASKRGELILEATGGKSAARDVRGVAGAVDETGRAARRSSAAHRSFRKSLDVVGVGARAVGAGAKIGIAGITGIGVATAKTGIAFNASMEQNTVAFAGFLGSTKKAKKHLEGLYALSSNSPFEFGEVVTGSRRLLAFGQTAKQSNRWLATIGDTVAGIGGGSEEIGRLVGAIGQIQAKGKASTEEMLQIAELGIPAFDMLAKATGRSTSQIFDDLANGSISSKTALDALSKGMNKQFGGAAAAQAKTFSGQLSTLKDNARLLAGEASKPLFESLRTSVLPVMNRITTAMATGFKAGGLPGLIAGLDDTTGAGGRVVGAVNAIRGAVASVDFSGLAAQAKAGLAGVDVDEVLAQTRDAVAGAIGPLKAFADIAMWAFQIPGVKEAAIAFGAAALTLGALNKATGGAAGGLGRTGLASLQLVTALVGLSTALISAGVTLQAFSLAMIRAKIASAIAFAQILLIRGVILAWTIATKAAAAAQWLLNAAMNANPIAKVVLAVGLLVGAFVLAYRKVDWFRSAVDAVWGALKTAWGWIASNGPKLLSYLPMVALVRNFDRVKDAASGILSTVKRVFGSIVSTIASVPGKIGGVASGMFDSVGDAASKVVSFAADRFRELIDFVKRVPGAIAGVLKSAGGLPGKILGKAAGAVGLATGGTVKQSGWATVGERGPELLRLPRAATIFDSQQTHEALRPSPHSSTQWNAPRAPTRWSVPSAPVQSISVAAPAVPREAAAVGAGETDWSRVSAMIGQAVAQAIDGRIHIVADDINKTVRTAGTRAAVQRGTA